ncbi:MAG: GNAT family N-acetyltransferase [Oscillochloris sp.]|nr:GNAT family N-acetyltransferase [Oscillochloris sp.]
MPIPTLSTEQLILRAFTAADGSEVERLAGAAEVAETTLNIPHPYPSGGGIAWIAGHAETFELGIRATWAITLAADDQLLGGITANFNQQHMRAELGYWVGVPYWGQGYTTAAARAVLRYCFSECRLNRVVAHHLPRNPASGRVMQKIGMRYEGTLRQHMRKGEAFEDLVAYGILLSEWREMPR